MRKWKFFVVLFIIASSIAGYILWRTVVSPQFSLKQLKKTVSEQNTIAFEKYVDLDHLVGSIITQTWQYYASEKETEVRWDNIRNEISQSILSLVAPNLKEMIKKEVLRYVGTGQWNEKREEDKESIYSFIIQIIREKINPGNWEYQVINYLKIDDSNAFVGLTYYDKSKFTNFLVEVKMRNMKGYWQLIEITNIAELIPLVQAQEVW
ncbi:MAG: hypothetical protein JXC36_00630 [Candidatus Atribacteria bacterium]|nr:hypothetical protein [Candidatus Atribacteria bacterium]